MGDVLPVAVDLSHEEYRLLVDYDEILSFLRLQARLADGTRTSTITVVVCMASGCSSQ